MVGVWMEGQAVRGSDAVVISGIEATYEQHLPVQRHNDNLLNGSKVRGHC